MSYVVHIVAGSLSFLFGYVALYSAKGGARHRTLGRLFVYAMLPMAAFGMLIAAVRDKAPAVNIPMGLFTSYLVLTALAAVRPSAASSRRLHALALVVALGVGAAYLTFGVEALRAGAATSGMPAFPFFLFGTVSLLAAAGDLRVIRRGARTGAARLARHLWRMSFALAIAALSFGVQMTKFIPREFRVPGLLMLPVLAVLVTMFYWLWRVRVRRSLRGIVGVAVPTAVVPGRP